MRRFALLIALLPGALPAADGDYATQWPLQLERPDAAAYRVVLDESVYRTVHRRDLRDLDVLDAAGAPVPAAVFAAEPPAAPASTAVALPWYALPTPDGDGARDWAVIGRAGPDGGLQHIEARSSAPVAGRASRTALLIDARSTDGPVSALDLQWQPAEAIDLGYRVEGSDDLEHWHEVRAQGRLVDLQRGSTRLLQRRITLAQPATWRYLRLTPERIDRVPTVTGVQALVTARGTTPTVHWRSLAAAPARRSGNGTQFEYTLDGRFPIAWVDVAMASNSAVRWRLESRATDDAPWRAHGASWVAFQLDNAGERDRSPPRALGGPARDRHWRLTADRAVAAAPTLKLGYRPEAIVFLAEGTGPYALVAGSARVQRTDAPLPQLIATLREQHGPGWAPTPATLGASRTLAGPDALSPRRDWTAWLLWGVLGVGALLVAALAMSVLRRTPAGRP